MRGAPPSARDRLVELTEPELPPAEVRVRDEGPNTPNVAVVLHQGGSARSSTNPAGISAEVDSSRGKHEASVETKDDGLQESLVFMIVALLVGREGQVS